MTGFRQLYPLSDTYDCQIDDADSIIDDYRDGLLPDESREAFEEHLLYCHTCSEGLQLRQNVASILNAQASPLQRQRWYWIAAAAVLLLFSVPLFFQDSSPGSMTEFQTARAETGQLELTDGSTVIVNYGSHLQYSSKFGQNERYVRLNGEAYFDVAGSPVPFIIETENARIKVTGTQFNVWARSAETRLTVSEGTVTFGSSEGSQSISLQSNEMSICLGSDDPGEPQTVNAAYLIGWLDNKLVFQKASLNSILTELELAFDVTIDVAANVNTETRLSFDIAMGSLEDVLDTVCFQLGLQYERDETSVKIMKNEE